MAVVGGLAEWPELGQELGGTWRRDTGKRPMAQVQVGQQEQGQRYGEAQKLRSERSGLHSVHPPASSVT